MTTTNHSNLTTKCELCDLEFIKSHFNVKYCTNECREIARKICRTPASKVYIVDCLECGNTFVSKKKHYKRCSELCRKIGNAKVVKEWHEDNPDSTLKSRNKYRKTQPGKFRNKKRRDLVKNKTVQFTTEQLAQRWAYFGNSCVYCGDTDNLTLDHTKPLSKGGWHCLSNLRPACASCNSSKKESWYGPNELHKIRTLKMEKNRG